MRTPCTLHLDPSLRGVLSHRTTQLILNDFSCCLLRKKCTDYISLCSNVNLSCFYLALILSLNKTEYFNLSRPDFNHFNFICRKHYLKFINDVNFYKFPVRNRHMASFKLILIIKLKMTYALPKHLFKKLFLFSLFC